MFQLLRSWLIFLSLIFDGKIKRASVSQGWVFRTYFAPLLRVLLDHCQLHRYNARFFAQMAELVDALVSGTSVRKDVEVRVFFWAPNFKGLLLRAVLFVYLF